MSDTLVELCRELVEDRRTAADIPWPTTQIIDKIEVELTRLRNAEQQRQDTKAAVDAVAGWAFPTLNARKCHYFPASERRSLCGKYLLSSGVERSKSEGQEYIPSSDDCAACKAKVLAGKGAYAKLPS